MRATLSGPNHLSRTPPLPSHWGVAFNAYILERYKHLVCHPAESCGLLYVKSMLMEREEILLLVEGDFVTFLVKSQKFQKRSISALEGLSRVPPGAVIGKTTWGDHSVFTGEAIVRCWSFLLLFA